TLRGREFCTAYTNQVDSWLRALFAEAMRTEASSSPGQAWSEQLQSGPALVALGGHGRGELCPQSDLDLLLLIPKRYDAESVAEALWYPIWDTGLKLGHSVRSVKDTLILATDDLETATALLSARHLAGNAALTGELVEKARASWRRNGRHWTEVLASTVSSRHNKEGDIAFTLEPDLKEGRGGLRDVHALGWAAMAGAPVDDELIAALGGDYDTLLAARIELHRATERHTDRLLLQEQDQIAKALDLVDADSLMSGVTAAARSIAWASDEAWFDIQVAVTARSGAVISRSSRLGSAKARSGSSDRDLGNGIVMGEGRVRLADETKPIIETHLPLQVALCASIKNTRISAATLDLMAEAPKLSEPWDERARGLFCDLLLSGASSIEVIEALDRCGVWGGLVREWDHVRGLQQRNALHKFTVDRHLLECAARAADLAERTPRPDLLVVGALLHDIGKGYRGDHSVTGELLASGIARKMGFTPGEASTVGFLARWHLLLTDTATRRDLDDPATIRHVADIVGSADRLSLLHALSEADGLATGTGIWTTWSAALVEQLVAAVLDLIDPVADPAEPSGDHAAPEARDLGAGGVSGSVSADVGTGSHPVLPMVKGEGEWIAIVCEDRTGVICRVAGVLALHGLEVMEATAESNGDVAIDRFRVKSSVSGIIRWDRVADDVEQALTGRLAIRARLAERARSHRRRYEPGLSQLDVGVRFDDELATGATMIEVVGLDRIGLLYELTRALGEFDIDIRSAKIHTLGVDVIDTFYVTDRNGRPVVDREFQQEIQRSLEFILAGAE
ncbi:MAG TPA: [protein-PII] uridylyltransferase, partial [Microthrixaceae bacterium]|nr:[protein-PII] uridylyltransferase [Microthrixaceae bacterium]